MATWWLQFTCLICRNCFSVIQGIFLCLDVVSQVFLVVLFLDWNMNRHMAPVPAWLSGVASPTHWSTMVVLREELCLGSLRAMPLAGNELSETTFPPFILQLCLVRVFIFMGLSSHMRLSEWLEWEWEQQAWALSSSWLLLHADSYTSYFISILLPPWQLFNDFPTITHAREPRAS